MGHGFERAFLGDQGVSEALSELSRAKIKADAKASRLLAEQSCPNDLKEWGRAHGIPTFAEVTWMAGFLTAWRLAHSIQDDPAARAALKQD